MNHQLLSPVPCPLLPTTAFVSHPDCSRHDTGWKHPDHQGRLPALVRAVYRDMLTLHGHLHEIEARAATEEELLLVHTPGYLERVRQAVEQARRAGHPLPLEGEMVVSGASWDAATHAAGAGLSAADAILRGEVRNAFCAVRPPGHTARPDAAGGFALFNNVAIAGKVLREQRGIERLLIAHWGGAVNTAIAELFAGDPGTRVLCIGERSPETSYPTLPQARFIALPPGSDGALHRAAWEAALGEALADWTPDFALLSAGFDALAADPLGTLRLEPRDFYELTLQLRERADALCDGRLVSVLEGGYASAAVGEATVQHLRALIGLPVA